MRIFILEDDPTRVRVFRRNMIGHEVVVCSNVDEAKTYLREGEWNVAFLDHDLDGRIYVDSEEPNTGYQLAKWMVEQPHLQNTHVVIHSFNEIGREKMRQLLPDTAQAFPGVWHYLDQGWHIEPDGSVAF